MRKFLVLLACMALLSGCVQSNIVQPTAETKIGEPDFEVKDDVEIDWQQVSLDAEGVFEDTNEYPYSKNFSFHLEPNKKEIMLVWVVSDDLPDSELQRYMEDLIKGFNDTVATQDFSIETSGTDSYGGLWKDYALSFGIAPESTQDDQETWFVSGGYAAGSEFVLPNINDAIDRANQSDGQSSPAEESAEAPADDTGAESESAEQTQE